MAKNKKLNYKNINAKSVANNLYLKNLKNLKNISTATALCVQADLILENLTKTLSNFVAQKDVALLYILQQKT